MWRHAQLVAPQRGLGQDRVAVFERDGGLVIVLADGAGGTGGGARAAETVVAGVGAWTDTDWCAALAGLDARTGGGQTTAVVVTVGAGGLAGASVGDSCAWLIFRDITDLTSGQMRKPLVGGGCTPCAIRGGVLRGATLLVASDGLVNYAKRADIARIARGADLDASARALVDLVRLPSGGLQDDVSIVLCR